jgi:hypothetical protein
MYVPFGIKQVNFSASTHVPIEHSNEEETQLPVESSHSVSFGLKQEKADVLWHVPGVHREYEDTHAPFESSHLLFPSVKHVKEVEL